ncbi:Biosynthetic peptidoglycan transglycosylase [Streptomyces tendae]
MSDEPQPQQPGWAPRDPQAAGKGQAGEPGTPGAAGTPGASAKAKKPRRPKRTGWRRLIPTWRIALSTVVVGLLLIVGGFFLGYHLVQIPAANALATKQSNVYLYADGSVLARDGEVNRESVGLARISKDAQHAVLAAEDRDFYTESAIDPGAMVRAGWNTATGKGKQSGSTITPAVRQELLPGPGADRHPQGEGVLHLDQARPGKEQRARSSRATSTPASSAAAPTASRPPPRPTSASTPRTSPPPRAPTSPPCSTPPASTTSSPTRRTGPPPRPAGTTS